MAVAAIFSSFSSWDDTCICLIDCEYQTLALVTKAITSVPSVATTISSSRVNPPRRTNIELDRLRRITDYGTSTTSRWTEILCALRSLVCEVIDTVLATTIAGGAACVSGAAVTHAGVFSFLTHGSIERVRQMVAAGLKSPSRCLRTR